MKFINVLWPLVQGGVITREAWKGRGLRTVRPGEYSTTFTDTGERVTNVTTVYLPEGEEELENPPCITDEDVLAEDWLVLITDYQSPADTPETHLG